MDNPAVLGLVTIAISLTQSQGTTISVAPPETTVAVVTAINATGNTSETLRRRQIEEEDDAIVSGFKARGFKVLPLQDVVAATKKLGIDFADEENQRREPLFRVAHEVQAKLVVFCVITDTHQQESDQFFYTKLQGFTKEKLWLLATDPDQSVISAKTIEGRAGGNYAEGGSHMQIRAAFNAAEKLLAPFLDLYPKIKL